MFWQFEERAISDPVQLALFAAWGVVPFPVSPTAGVVTFQAVGDSLTSWEGLELDGRPRLDVSWIDAACCDGLLFLGGWARGGAESADMVANLPVVVADVLVILAGTNDVNHGLSQSVTVANITALGASTAGRVVLVAIPPNDAHLVAAASLNGALEALAGERSWVFVDPWRSFRDCGGAWVVGASPDGVHPDRFSATRAGHVIANRIMWVPGS